MGEYTSIDKTGRTIYYNGDICTVGATEIIESVIEFNKLIKEEKRDEFITLNLTSNGGDMESAMMLYHFLSKNKVDVFTETYSSVWSSATLVFLAGKERRAESRGSTFLFHPTVGSAQARYPVDIKHML